MAIFVFKKIERLDFTLKFVTYMKDTYPLFALIKVSVLFVFI
jgi:hypothetical protein